MTEQDVSFLRIGDKVEVIRDRKQPPFYGTIEDVYVANRKGRNVISLVVSGYEFEEDNKHTNTVTFRNSLMGY